MNAQEILGMIDNVSGIVGSDDTEKIESAMSDLITIKDFVNNVDMTTTALEDDVEKLNVRCRELQSANNKIMRELHNQKEYIETANENVTRSAELAQIF